jgi:hypothetical protein
MDAGELVKVIGACSRARVKVFKAAGVEIFFEDPIEVITQKREAQDVTEDVFTDVHKKNIEEFDKSQLEFETEMSVITDPLAWERGATVGKE